MIDFHDFFPLYDSCMKEILEKYIDTNAYGDCYKEFKKDFDNNIYFPQFDLESTPAMIANT